MRMLCYKCNHPWNYRGKNTEEKDNITCPKCMYKLVLGKALIEGPSEQKLLANLPNKKLLPNRLPSLLPSKLPTTNEFEMVILEEGMEVLVDKRIAKQFKEAPEYLDEEIECVISSSGKERSGMSEMGIKICEDHGLPARYDSTEKKWVCEECNLVVMEQRSYY